MAAPRRCRGTSSPGRRAADPDETVWSCPLPMADESSRRLLGRHPTTADSGGACAPPSAWRPALVPATVHDDEVRWDRPKEVSQMNDGGPRSADSSRDQTLFLPPRVGAAAKRHDASDSTTGLTPDLKRQIMTRLRAVALIYSATFFVADWVPAIFMRETSSKFNHVEGWSFSIGSIVLGILVAAAASSERLRWNVRMRLGLAFQVVSTYGIAFAMYHMVGRGSPGPVPDDLYVVSPSWPAPWLVCFPRWCFRRPRAGRWWRRSPRRRPPGCESRWRRTPTGGGARRARRRRGRR